MYSKEELKQLKKEFWEGFGTYCSMLPAMKRRKSKFMLYNTKMGRALRYEKQLISLSRAAKPLWSND